MRVRDVMSEPAVVVAPETPVKHAAALLDEHGFTCLPVVDSDGKLVGAVSEADLLMNRFPPDPRIPLLERPEREAGAAVCDVMTDEVLTADPQDQVSDLLVVLHTSRHRSVPVVEAGVVLGVVTYRDLVHALMTTLRAPARRCAAAAGRVRNRPVASTTTSTPRSSHGRSSGSGCCRTRIS
jgi:CBS-domain-containing membrane protein